MEGAYIALWLSLKVAFWATFFNLLLAVAVSFFLTKAPGYIKVIADTLLTMPMVLPPTVIGYYLLVLVGNRSFIGKWLNETFAFSFVFTWQGAVLAAMIVSFPLIFKPAFVAFEQLNSDYENAAKVIGLSNAAVFFTVSLPLAWKAILAGTLLSLARSLGEFGATLMLAGSIEGKTQTLSIAIWEAILAGKDSQAQFLVLVISIVSLLILLSVNFIHKNKS